MKIRYLCIGALMLVLLIYAVRPQQTEQAEAAIGESAPRIELASLDGQTHTLRPSSADKILIVNFWATWCEPCKQEARELQAFYETHRDRVELVAVNLTSKDKLADVQAFATKYGLRFPVLLDEKSKAADAYHIAGLPTTYWIDSGIVTGRKVGPVDRFFLEGLLPKERPSNRE